MSEKKEVESPNTDSFSERHVLQGAYFNQTLRLWHSTATFMHPSNLIFPLFIHENDDADQEIASLPGIKRIGLNKLKDYLKPIVDDGLRCVILFGVIESDSLKDERGSHADSPSSSVIRTIPKLREWYPELTVACDVCLCAYTSHGHCGVFNKTGNQEIDSCLHREKSVERIAQVAIAYAKAGAQIVAPSDMMDGRIDAIKKLLNQNNMLNRVSQIFISKRYIIQFISRFV